MNYELSTNCPGRIHCFRCAGQQDKTEGVDVWTHVYYGYFPGHTAWSPSINTGILTSPCHLSSGFWHTLLTKHILTTINLGEVGVASLKSCEKCMCAYALFGNHVELSVHITSSCCLSKNLQAPLCSFSSSGPFSSWCPSPPRKKEKWCRNEAVKIEVMYQFLC